MITVLTLLAMPAWATEPTPFVIQPTRSSDNYGHRRALMQIDRVLTDLGDDNVKIVVVAYENGIHALLAGTQETHQLVTELANRGVEFRACRISMNAWELTEDEFALEA